MTINSLDTTFKTQVNRLGPGAYHVVEAKALASTATTTIAVPYTGKLVRAEFCNGATVMSASNNYKVKILNASTSDTVMAADTTDGVNDFGGTGYTGAYIAAYGNADLALSATAADLDVSAGDMIEVVMTVEGTVTDANVLLFFEATA